MIFNRRIVLFFICMVFVLAGFYFFWRTIWFPKVVGVSGMRTVADVIELYGASADADLQAKFAVAGVT